MIYLFGPRDDAQIKSVGEALGRLGREFRVFDTGRFPESPQVGFTPEGVVLDGAASPFARGVYLRTMAPAPVAPDPESERNDNRHAAMAAGRERHALLAGLLLRMEAEGARIANPVWCEARVAKPFQLYRLRQAGIDVPDTLVTNDPAAAAAFARRHARVLYKPVWGGATARLLEAKDLTPERLALLANAPVTFQEFVPGDNIRVYVVGGKVVASAVIETSDEVDFRRGEGYVFRVDLPAHVEEGCLRGARLFDLRLTSIDIKRDGDRWAFLEFNTSPMFAVFDAKSGCRVGESLAAWLAGEAA
jgi:glutathione synthase/RimK-type ligase-like ATP-grasp enzyme